MIFDSNYLAIDDHLSMDDFWDIAMDITIELVNHPINFRSLQSIANSRGVKLSHLIVQILIQYLED